MLRVAQGGLKLVKKTALTNFLKLGGELGKMSGQ
jgi:hypothetical protein